MVHLVQVGAQGRGRQGAYPLMLAAMEVEGPELAALGVALPRKLYAGPINSATVCVAMP